MLPIRNRSCGVIGVSPSRSAAAISASIAASGPREAGRRSSRSRLRSRASDPPRFWAGVVETVRRRRAGRCRSSKKSGPVLLVHMVSAYGAGTPSRASISVSRASMIAASASLSWSKPSRCRTPCTTRWREMVGQRLALLRRLARDGLEGEHDIAEQDRRAATAAARPVGQREGQHVGRGILAAPGPVQRALLGIVGQDDADEDRPVGRPSVRRRAPRAPLPRPATRHRGRRSQPQRSRRSRGHGDLDGVSLAAGVHPQCRRNALACSLPDGRLTPAPRRRAGRGRAPRRRRRCARPACGARRPSR